MTDAGKWLIFAGLAIAVIGAIVWVAGRAGFRGLPGDISYHRENVHIYFPIVTCVVLSVVLTLAMWLWRWMSRR
jgi:hypothetical protein